MGCGTCVSAVKSLCVVYRVKFVTVLHRALGRTQRSPSGKRTKGQVQLPSLILQADTVPAEKYASSAADGAAPACVSDSLLGQIEADLRRIKRIDKKISLFKHWLTVLHEMKGFSAAELNLQVFLFLFCCC